MGRLAWVAGTVLIGMPKSLPKSGWMLTLPSSARTLVVQLVLTGLADTSAFQGSSGVNSAQPPLVEPPPAPPSPVLAPAAPPTPAVRPPVPTAIPPVPPARPAVPPVPAVRPPVPTAEPPVPPVRPPADPPPVPPPVSPPAPPPSGTPPIWVLHPAAATIPKTTQAAVHLCCMDRASYPG